MATWAEMPRSPGHAFYDRLQDLLREAGFDAFVEQVCKPYYAPRMGAPSLPPGRYSATTYAKREAELHRDFVVHEIGRCVNSTARAGFNRGYAGTVVADATATRDLPNPTGGVVPASAVHAAALTALGDLFAIVVGDPSAIP
jgi:hypothetical protein